MKKIAGEFYDDLPQHNSWVRVIYDFIMDPDIGPYARVKRRDAMMLDGRGDAAMEKKSNTLPDDKQD